MFSCPFISRQMNQYRMKRKGLHLLAKDEFSPEYILSCKRSIPCWDGSQQRLLLNPPVPSRIKHPSPSSTQLEIIFIQSSSLISFIHTYQPKSATRAGFPLTSGKAVPYFPFTSQHKVLNLVNPQPPHLT